MKVQHFWLRAVLKRSDFLPKEKEKKATDDRGLLENLFILPSGFGFNTFWRESASSTRP